MRDRKIMTAVSVALLAACCVHMACTYGLMPNRIATRFDARGVPNGWSDKRSFVVLYGAMLIAFNVLLVVFRPLLVSISPDWMVNMPWKSYWYATPERKQRALGKMHVMMIGSGALMNLILLVVWHHIYQENVRNPVVRVPCGVILGVIFGLAALLIAATVLYSIPPKEKFPPERSA